MSRRLVETTSPGGKLFESQQRAVQSLDVWKTFFQAALAKDVSAVNNNNNNSNNMDDDDDDEDDDKQDQVDDEPHHRVAGSSRVFDDDSDELMD